MTQHIVFCFHLTKNRGGRPLLAYSHAYGRGHGHGYNHGHGNLEQYWNKLPFFLVFGLMSSPYRAGFRLLSYVQTQAWQSGRGHRDDRAKNGSKNSQRFDHKMGSRGRFGMFGI